MPTTPHTEQREKTLHVENQIIELWSEIHDLNPCVGI